MITRVMMIMITTMMMMINFGWQMSAANLAA